MTTERLTRFHCDRCNVTEDRRSNGGGTPFGWGRVWINGESPNASMDHVDTIVFELCDDCFEGVLKSLPDLEAGSHTGVPS